MRKFILALACAAASVVQAMGVNQVSQQQQQQVFRGNGMPAVSPGLPAPMRRPDVPSPVAVPEPAAAVTDPREAARAAVASASPEVEYTYDNVGNRESATYKNGVVVLYQYDRRNRLVDLHASRSGTLIHHYHYTLDGTGLRTRVDGTDAEGASTVTTYIYDAVKRLTDEAQMRNGIAIFAAHYEYDQVGNRKVATVNGVTTSYAYDTNDRLTSEITSGGPLAGTTAYTHDGSGNMLTKDGPLGHVDYVYNDAGRLSEVRAGGDVVEYTYNVDGLMMGKTWTPLIGTPTTWRYLWDTSRGTPQTIEELSAQGAGSYQLSAKYIFGDGLISETRDGSTHYVITDGFGDTRALVDSGGATTDTFSYDAWGNMVGRTGNTPASYLYRGERLDPNLGFYYLRARWMDPTIGRFTQMDDYNGHDQAPASLHKYLYANGDPVNHIDPTGHSASGLVDSLTAVGIAAIIAITATITIDYITRPSGGGQRQFGVYDAIAVPMFRAATQSESEEDANPTIAALAAVAAKEQGHHTIPVYLCGAMEQDTSKIPLADHVLIHTQIAAIRIALDTAESYASKALGKYRSLDVLRIAQTQPGRQAIAEALYKVYDWGNWLGVGDPKIEDVFKKERGPFESGQKTSLPWCTRQGGPIR